MRSLRPHRTSARPGQARAFTLVELITAASLMTVVMLGVVEIFSIVMDTASEAESQNFANQQLRSLFDRMNRDIHGMARQGYLYVRPTACTWENQTPGVSTGSIPGDTQYSFYTLGFVSLGTWMNMWDTPATLPACNALAAEVVYTNYVLSPTDLLKVQGNFVDIRRGILARGIWMMDGQAHAGTGTQTSDYSHQNLRYFTNMYSNAISRQVQWSVGGASVMVVPWLKTTKAPADAQNAASLKRVMASCVSEFLVEYWDDTLATPAWQKLAINYGPSSANNWPKAIRVTAVVHNPNNLEPLPVGQKRFEGYAAQEVFWIGDP